MEPRREGETESQAIARYVDPDLLIIDEIGATKKTNFELEILMEVIDQRYENCRPSIMISNLSDIDELQEWAGERVIERMRHSGRAVMFNWESMRGSL